MVDEKAHAAAVELYGEYARFFISTMEEVGKEKTMQIHERAFEMYGQGIVGMLKPMFPEKVDLKQLGNIFAGSQNNGGFESEVVMKDEDTLIIRNTVCPKYDAFKMHGIDDETIEEYCLRGVRVLDRFFKEVESGLEFTVPKWDAGNGCCDEQIKRT